MCISQMRIRNGEIARHINTFTCFTAIEMSELWHTKTAFCQVPLLWLFLHQMPKNSIREGKKCIIIVQKMLAASFDLCLMYFHSYQWIFFSTNLSGCVFKKYNPYKHPTWRNTCCMKKIDSFGLCWIPYLLLFHILTASTRTVF